MYEVELRPFVGTQPSPLGPVDVEHPIKKVFANAPGQNPIRVGYYYEETGHLALTNCNLVPSQVEFIKAKVAEQYPLKVSTQAKPLVDTPDAPQAAKPANDLQELGL